MTTECVNITDDHISWLAEFNDFLKSELVKSRQKETQESGEAQVNLFFTPQHPPSYNQGS
ncbi:hypothetical protein NHP22001_10420 [Helicobacter sp. NHP22-001]|nr:hypothetical protein NHP22001_10420 [Helicobacter sp. NHP22-001]